MGMITVVYDGVKAFIVIKALECSINGAIHCFDGSCYYHEHGNTCDREQIMIDALALLKEQEPILLENQHKPYGNSLNANAPWISRCPRCGKKVEGKQTRFCKYCGQAVKWE